MIVLPPLPLKLPPLPPPGAVVVSAPGSQSWRTTDMPRVTSSGADWVQVVLDKGPDDSYARVELVAAGVELHPGSLAPKRGTLHIMLTTGGKCVYRWRV